MSNSMYDSQRYPDMSDAYRAIYENRFAAHGGKDTDAGAKMAKQSDKMKGSGKTYTMKGKDGKPLFGEAKGYQEGGEVGKDDNKKPMGFPVPVIPGRMINKRTEVNIEVNPQKEKIGDVEKAYYTYPQGFDPTNREDITRKGTTNESVEEEVEVTDEEFFNYMVQEGIAESEKSAEAMVDHMSDEWLVQLYEESKKKKGRCWTGYKPTPGKEAFSPGSCEKA